MTTLVTKRENVKLVLDEAEQLSVGPASKQRASELVKILRYHRDNYSAALGLGIRRLCPTEGVSEIGKRDGRDLLPQIDIAVAKLREKHKLGLSTASKVGIGLTVGAVALGVANRFNKLPTAISQYVPSFSMSKEVGEEVLLNETSSNLQNIVSGASSLLPSITLTNALFGAGVVAVALTVAYVAKNYCLKAKQA